MRTILVTAADDNFFSLLQDLLRSLHRWPEQSSPDIGVLDLGLRSDQRAWVARIARHIVEPGWDLPVDDFIRENKSHYRALTARPFLPSYFPGYDLYLWIDSDAWVQELFAIEMLIAAASAGSLAAVPESHPAYNLPLSTIRWRTGRMLNYFGKDGAINGRWDTYLNAGVLALRCDAPHWAAWIKWFKIGLQVTSGKLCCDQTALNHAVRTENLRVTMLPARCNWLCHLAVPSYNKSKRRFCEPHESNEAIGILHLTWQTKNVSSNSKDRSLRYSGSHLRHEGTAAETLPLATQEKALGS